MSTLRKTTTFTRDVVAQIPVDDGFVSVPFRPEYRILKQSEIAGLRDGDLLRKALVGVTGLKDENGNALSSTDAINDVIESPPASAVAVSMYVKEITRVEAGNSKA